MIKFLLIDFWKGVLCGIKNIFSKPVTRDIVSIENERPEHFRRHFSISNSEKSGKCIGCRICMSVCPCDAINIKDKNHCEYQQDKCSYCGLCEKSCPKKAIVFTNKKPES